MGRNHVVSPPGLRILVVEDNELVAYGIAVVLRRKGHEVRVAASGLAALADAGADPPDVALVDIGLPDIDGYEVARRFRDSRDRRDVLLVALTGQSDDESRERSEEAGFACHLARPVGFADLERVLARAVPTAPVLA
jgi:two-component system CheB/CheR fusion protein